MVVHGTIASAGMFGGSWKYRKRFYDIIRYDWGSLKKSWWVSNGLVNHHFAPLFLFFFFIFNEFSSENSILIDFLGKCKLFFINHSFDHKFSFFQTFLTSFTGLFGTLFWLEFPNLANSIILCFAIYLSIFLQILSGTQIDFPTKNTFCDLLQFIEHKQFSSRLSVCIPFQFQRNYKPC